MVLHMPQLLERATISETLFLDIHYDPTTPSYSYALIDLTSPHPGDKRILGWDDYPHEGVETMPIMKCTRILALACIIMDGAKLGVQEVTGE